MSTITIDKKTITEIYEQAVQEYPGESCGWIIENADKSLQYYPAENLQDKYHKLDPESFPRTSRDAFLIDTLKMNRAIEEASSQGGKLFSIVHSHIDCGAYFSDEDKIQMSTPDGEEPVYPATCYLVVSVVNKEPSENAAFVFDENEKDFIQKDLIISN